MPKHSIESTNNWIRFARNLSLHGSLYGSLNGHPFVMSLKIIECFICFFPLAKHLYLIFLPPQNIQTIALQRWYVCRTYFVAASHFKIIVRCGYRASPIFSVARIISHICRRMRTVKTADSEWQSSLDLHFPSVYVAVTWIKHGIWKCVKYGRKQALNGKLIDKHGAMVFPGAIDMTHSRDWKVLPSLLSCVFLFLVYLIRC